MQGCDIRTCRCDFYLLNDQHQTEILEGLAVSQLASEEKLACCTNGRGNGSSCMDGELVFFHFYRLPYSFDFRDNFPNEFFGFLEPLASLCESSCARVSLKVERIGLLFFFQEFFAFLLLICGASCGALEELKKFHHHPSHKGGKFSFI